MPDMTLLKDLGYSPPFDVCGTDAGYSVEDSQGKVCAFGLDEAAAESYAKQLNEKGYIED